MSQCRKLSTKLSQLTIRQWCNVHVYVIDGFRKVLLLLNLERVVSRGFSNNLILLIVRSWEEYDGLTIEQIVNKVVYFGSNGVLVFTIVHMGVVIQLKSKVAPFFSIMHCMAPH
jgi:uncharacterized protein related to proFAR isomerase